MFRNHLYLIHNYKQDLTLNNRKSYKKPTNQLNLRFCLFLLHLVNLIQQLPVSLSRQLHFALSQGAVSDAVISIHHLTSIESTILLI